MSTPDLCQHLGESSSLAQPFTFHTLGQNPVYACPACTTAAIQESLTARKAPGAVASRVYFDRCDHETVATGKRCHACTRAVRASLDAVWSQLHFADKPAANRLQKVIDVLFKSEDAKAIEAERKNILVRDAVAKATRQITKERREDAEREFRRQNGMRRQIDVRPFEQHETTEAAWGSEAQAIRQGAA
ncbi:MAG TPA: hypothetical protein VHX20_19760 [Terracidiphilus sp.]|jgi:hypothetical protein|nr:hypothetical protein [Terracidiphilus sp.]